MATQLLQAESATANPSEMEVLYAAYRHAKAAWDVASYAPEYVNEDLPDEIANDLCERTCEALNAYLLHPVKTAFELFRKLQVFREEDIIGGWYKGAQIVDQLILDAKHVAGVEPK